MKKLLQLAVLLVASLSFGQTPIYQFNFQTLNATIGSGTFTFQNDGPTGAFVYVADRSEVGLKAARLFKQIGTANLAGLPTGNSARTISCWVDHKNTDAVSLFTYGGQSSGQAFGLEVYPLNNQIAFLGFGGPAYDTYISRTTVLNSWTHYAVTYDGSAVRVYVNGALFGVQVMTLNTINSEFKLGIDATNAAKTGNIVFDDLNIFSTALTAAEITTLFRRNDSQTPLEAGVPTNGLVFANHFTGGNISDSSQTGAVVSSNRGATNAVSTPNSRTFALNQTMTYDIDNYDNDLRVGSSFFLGGSNNFSIAIQVKFDPNYLFNITAGQYITFYRHGSIFMRYLRAANLSFILQAGYQNSSGNFRICSYNVGSDLSGWKTIVFTNDSFDCRLYLNDFGAPPGSTGGGDVLYTFGAQDKIILGITGVNGQSFAGLIDNVYVYNRALTSVEATALSATLSDSNFQTNDLKFSMYPNPSESAVTIDLETELKSVEIYTLQGQIVQTSTNKNVFLNNLPTGVYIVKVENVEGLSNTKKLVIK